MVKNYTGKGEIMENSNLFEVAAILRNETLKTEKIVLQPQTVLALDRAQAKEKAVLLLSTDTQQLLLNNQREEEVEILVRPFYE